MITTIGYIVTKIDAHLRSAAPELLAVLQDLLGCSFAIDEATVSDCGLEETMRLSPYQVVGNMSVSLVRLRNARLVVAKALNERG